MTEEASGGFKLQCFAIATFSSCYQQISAHGHFIQTQNHGVTTPEAPRAQGQHCSKIMKPPQSLPLQMANHVTARSISDWRALTWLATETGWARRKRSAIWGGKLNQCSHDSTRCEQEIRHLDYIYVSLCSRGQAVGLTSGVKKPH